MLKMNYSKFILLFLILAGVSTVNNAKEIPVLNSYSEFIGEQQDPYLAFAEVMPEPVGGLPAIYKKITYPAIAKSAGLEGKVYVLIFVNESGSVDNVKVIKGIGGGCDEAAIDAVKSIKYTPGKNQGVPVKVKLSLAINFKLK